ncbi:hemolysin family protein [uncultured Williamsia sp.]|uniref:hemolysin family protein n=1 Tax=uncultured Williamsia sp. TaxID=259311 RepID=UPI00260E8BA4|nr:hemolysin family protein [uncultured Williamsia sp.]
MNDWLGVLIAVALLAGNAFFVGAEFSLISARRDRLETLAEQGKRRARTVIRAGQDLSLMLAGAQLGITVCSILLGRVGEPAVAHLIEAPMDLVGIPDALLHPIGFTIALILVVALHILLGEMVPKNIALAGPEASAMLLVPIHLAWIRIAKPFIAFYNLAANLTLRVLRIQPRDELDATVSAGELAEMIGESRQEGLIDAEEHERLTRALRTAGRTVSEVAIPLDDLRSVRATTDPATGRTGPTLGSIERAVSETGFSRFPVRGTDGTFTGYLHLKDVLDEILDESVGPDTIIGADTIRPLPVISGDTSLDEATASLRRTSAHLGTVVDGNGRTTGVVALEDLVEEFVGTVRDETHRI